MNNLDDVTIQKIANAAVLRLANASQQRHLPSFTPEQTLMDSHANQRVLIGPRELAKRCGISRRFLYQMIAQKKVPAPIRLGRLIKWDANEISDWIARKCPPQEAALHAE